MPQTSLKNIVWALAFLVLGMPLGARWALAEDAPAQAAEKAIPEDEYYELMRVFADTFEQIDQNYVKDVDRRQLIEAAIRGMLAELDPYSDYINPEEVAQFNEAVDQEFGGIGIQVQWREEKRAIEVTTPLPGSPAYSAGIQAGDWIVEIEGKAVQDFPKNEEMQTAVKMLKGEPGVTVKVGYRRGEAEEIQRVDVTRQIIKLDTVLGDSYKPDGTWNYFLDPDKKIGYLRLSHFTARTATEVKSALRTLKNDGLNGLIIDLRFNPGGYLQSAVEIADMFLEEGLIVRTEGRNSAGNKWVAKKFGTYSGFPIAVLVNRYSASASEIVSAALQDHERAVVVGERSWGKGSVQNVMDVEDGKSKLKLTTATYYRPSGKNIHRFPGAKDEDEWGVKPNEKFEAPFSFEQMFEYQKYRRDRDVLTGTPPETSFVDSQLQKAREYIETQMAKSGEQPAQPDKEAKPGEDEKPAEPEKKAAGLRLPFFPVPKTRAA